MMLGHGRRRSRCAAFLLRGKWQPTLGGRVQAGSMIGRSTGVWRPMSKVVLLSYG